MWGFIHSTLVTLPMKVMGLVLSNSAEMEWCAASGNASTPTSPTTTSTFSVCALMISASRSESPLPVACGPRPSIVFVGLPDLDGAVDDVAQVVLLARILHQHVGRRLDAPRADVHPVLRVRLGVVHGDRVRHRVG